MPPSPQITHPPLPPPILLYTFTAGEDAWELEEKEALALQKRMAAALDEDDFDTADFEVWREELGTCKSFLLGKA